MNLNFVVSTGRCGSTLVSRILRENPDVLSVNELFGIVPVKDRLAGIVDGRAFWRQIVAPVPVMDLLVRHGLALPEFLYPYATGRFTPQTGVPFISHMTLPMLTDTPDDLYDWLEAIVPQWPTRPAPDHFRHLFALLSARFGGRIVVERAGGSIKAVSHLHRAFPDARFVYLSRDGMDCAVSMSKHAGCRLPVLTRTPDALASAGPRGVIADPGRHGERLPAIDVGHIMQYDIPLAAFGDFWSDMTITGATQLQEIPDDRWMTLRYEELLNDPVTSLQRLTRFLGASSPTDWLAWATGQMDPTRTGAADRLEADDFAELGAACAPGYAAEEALFARADPAL
ncbi:sulfotransferase family protein [Streptomyces ipomoeae]|uniref:sulfotransferase family protein n=1 Tax=Streptomyces ipomoeae TaxID=103232 RepID=UPI001146AC7F|nr:sulfotransferase [Streptomyces ipomoeae]MDX2939123.1 sulfotransferase [Streptomyces ipomoeae]TQE30403.1 sulfotransferase [Streptomyces ipomoeae]